MIFLCGNWLNAQHGRSNWIYKKGFAKIQVKDDGKVWIAEIHFYTAHGKGRYLEFKGPAIVGEAGGMSVVPPDGSVKMNESGVLICAHDEP
ncbi:MAG: hypothetical protein CL923_09525 [Deltaproteobacteria bacterium]|nr:hypothetical protein [Deltaproteobacteria bacterium]